MGWLVGLLADWAELSWVDRRVFRSEGVDGCLDHMRCTPSTLVLLWYIPWYIQTKKRTIERGSYCLISRSVLCTLDSMRSDCRSGKNKRGCCCVYHTLCVVLYILFMHLFIPAELQYTMQLYQFYMKYSIYVQHKPGQGCQMKPCHTHGGCSYIPSLTYQDGGLSDPSHGGQKLLLHYIS